MNNKEYNYFMFWGIISFILIIIISILCLLEKMKIITEERLEIIFIEILVIVLTSFFPALFLSLMYFSD